MESREGLMTLSQRRRGRGKVSGPWVGDDGVAGRFQDLGSAMTESREGLMTLSQRQQSREKVS
jgi:hypothetical protein